MKQFVVLELDKPRRLRFGINQLVLIEELTGKKLTNAGAFAEFGIKEIRDLVYCGLCHEDNALTPAIVGDLIDEYADIQSCFEKVGEAISMAFPQADTEKK